MQSLDVRIFLWLNGWAGRSRAADALWRGTAYPTPFIVTLVCLVILVRDPHAAGHFWLMAGAVIFSQAVTRLIRLAWHRPRPYDNPAVTTRKLLHKGHEASFPSAHAASLFAVGACVALFISPAVGAAILVLALLNAAARVVTGMHYPSDVLAGAMLGTVIGAGIGFLR